MERAPSSKAGWVVTQAAFDRLLERLDPDRERAGAKYEQIRQKLTKFFQWRGCTTPEDYTDRTIDRVARKIDEGAELHAQNVYLYFHGVALNVLREHWKGVQKTGVTSLDQSQAMQNAAAEDPHDISARHSERVRHERRLECLDGCIQKLPAPQLALITQYHQGEGGAKIARRNDLAKQLNIPLNALRIRAFRIRGDLEACVSECGQRQGR